MGISMGKSIKKGFMGVMVLIFMLAPGLTAHAAGRGTVQTGVRAGDIDLSGKSAAEATAAIEAYVEELSATTITLVAADNQTVQVTAGDMGITWANPGLVSEALALGTQGNVIERYKVIKDIENEGYVFDIELAFDREAISMLLSEQCAQYDREAINYSLKRENGQFTVIPGQEGYRLNVEASADKIYNFLTQEWDGQQCTIALDIEVAMPKGSAEELANVTDVLGSFTTSYHDSNASRCINVENGSRLLNGIVVYPGEEFSTCDLLTPFTRANGYEPAGSYMNGKVVDSIGGGICQVSTTLYNAVLLAELDVTMRYNHSMIVGYVDPSADAAIAESSGKDFCFVNSTEYPIYIESHTTPEKTISFNIYGKETRDANRQVRYESQVLEVISPSAEQIIADAGQPLGYVAVDSAHTGYKAKLWKIVTVNGVEISREQVNSSSYKMVPRSATIGVATADAHAYEEVMAAIGTGSIDHVRNVVAAVLAPPAPAEDEE